MSDKPSDTTPIWFKGQRPEDWVTRFTVGDDPVWDTMLLPYDIEASRGHMRGLEKTGVLTTAEADTLDLALGEILERYEEGEIQVRTEDEDCHTVIERLLTEIAGPTGGKIHTGRSRNDQVLAALRLWLHDRLEGIAAGARSAAERMLDFAEKEAETPIPGYTHMQRAMPSTAGLWAAGFAELLIEDVRLITQARSNIHLSPLGSAAGYGVPHFALPRSETAADLGFRGIHEAVTSVQLSRGKFELQVVHALVQLASTVNRFSSDCVLYASAEFGFLKLPPGLCTGSSIMPQKRNPDVFELARATLHRLTAELTLLITLPANLPSGYHRDLQLTKEAVMRAVLTTQDLVTALSEMLPEMNVDAAAAKQAMTPELWGTAAAMRRVTDGIPFRDAYRAAATDQASWQTEREEGTGPDARTAINALRARLSE